MVDMDLLKKRKITPENLKTLLDGDPLGRMPERSMRARIGTNPNDPGGDRAELDAFEKRAACMNRIRSRVQEGMSRNLGNYKHFYVLDKAWDTPFEQVTPTLIKTFLDSNPNDEQVYKAASDWGLTSMIVEKADSKNPGKSIKQFNFPTFFNVLVPLVKSYVTIRWAKIMNDRRLTPFFKFEPAKFTTENALKCDAITDRIQVMSNQYGYFDVMKQAVLKMLHYSNCFQFPREEWHSEQQLRIANKEDEAAGIKRPDPNNPENVEGIPIKEGDEYAATEREGIRYHLPHPTRTYYDIAHGPYTLNYDSGCEYAGFWQIVRYRDIVAGNFWNKDKIALGSMDIVGQNPVFFQTVYSACTLRTPVAVQPKTPDGATGAMTAGVGTGPLDREKQVGNLYYGNEYLDQGVLITNHYEKLVPKDNGFGDYAYPVWFRFVLAGDGCTVLYCTPVPYCPPIYYGYDADESRLMNASMSLEVLPFQDQFGNMLSQIVLTAKQNLANLTLLDEDQLTEDAKKSIQNIGESYHRFLNIFGYSGKKAFRGQNKVADIAHTVAFPKGNVAELINVLKTILDVLERVLVMSSQEVGQAASHEQTREEIRNIQSNTSSRQVFTSIPVDIARDAWKRQLYCGLMAFGDENMAAHVPYDSPLTVDELKAMGFTFNEKSTQPSKVPSSKIQFRRGSISKKRTAIDLWELAATRDGDDRMDKEKVAAAMAMTVDKLMANPVTAASIGADQAIDLANQICQLAGFPRDFKLHNAQSDAQPAIGSDGQPLPPDQGAAQEHLKQVVQAVLQQVGQEITPLLEEVKRNSQDMALVMKALNINPPNPADDPTATQAPSVTAS